MNQILQWDQLMDKSAPSCVSLAGLTMVTAIVLLKMTSSHPRTAAGAPTSMMRTETSTAAIATLQPTHPPVLTAQNLPTPTRLHHLMTAQSNVRQPGWETASATKACVLLANTSRLTASSTVEIARPSPTDQPTPTRQPTLTHQLVTAAQKIVHQTGLETATVMMACCMKPTVPLASTSSTMANLTAVIAKQPPTDQPTLA